MAVMANKIGKAFPKAHHRATDLVHNSNIPVNYNQIHTYIHDSR